MLLETEDRNSESECKASTSSTKRVADPSKEFPSRLKRKRKNEAAELGTVLQNTLHHFNSYIGKKHEEPKAEENGDILFGKIIASELKQIIDPIKKRNVKCKILEIFNGE